MKNDVDSDKSRYTIHLIYACSFLLAVVSVLGYLFWQKQQTIAIASIKEAKIKSCIQTAYNTNANAWALACIEQAQSVKKALDSCISEARYRAKFITASLNSPQYSQNLFLGWAEQCKNIYGEPNSAPDCMLANETGKALSEGLNKQVELCQTIN